MAQTFFPIDPVEVTPGVAGSWQDVDVSAHIAVGATGVVLHLVNTSGGIGEYEIGLRKNGSGDNRKDDLYDPGHCWAAIGVDANRKFEAYVQSTTYIDIYLVGYTMAGVTFFTNAHDKTPGVALAWTDIDCSVEAPDAVGLIFEVISISHGYDVGFRKDGSADNRINVTGKHYTFGVIIGCSDSQICEGYNPDIDYWLFFLVGYITDGCTFNLNATDVSLGATANWLDLAALPADSVMGFIEVIMTSDVYYGLRKDGSAEDIYYIGKQHPWAFVECASLIIEGKIMNTGVDFFVVGYATAPPAPPTGIQDKSASMGSKMVAAGLI